MASCSFEGFSTSCCHLTLPAPTYLVIVLGWCFPLIDFPPAHIEPPDPLASQRMLFTPLVVTFLELPWPSSTSLMSTPRINSPAWLMSAGSPVTHKFHPLCWHTVWSHPFISYIVYGSLLNCVSTAAFKSTPVYPTPSRYWQTIEKHKVTQFYTAPLPSISSVVLVNTTSLAMISAPSECWVVLVNPSTPKLGTGIMTTLDRSNVLLLTLSGKWRPDPSL